MFFCLSVCVWLTSDLALCPPVRLSLDSESDSSDGSHSPSRDPAPPPQKHNSSNNKVSHTDLVLLPAFIDVSKYFD